MADLKVDFEQLDASRTTLHDLRQEFGHATEIVADAGGIWGNGHVSSAMSDFAGNWRLHREKLLDRMSKVEEMTAGCIESFRHADEKIATGLTVRR